MKYGVAIIGIGNIAKKHFEGYLLLKDKCEVKVLCDIFEDKAIEFKDYYNLSCEVITDYKEILDRDDIHIVSVCLPPSFHKQITCDFLKHNKNVLCEKPMAASLSEAREMIKAKDNSKGLLSIISQNRFNKSLMKIKKMLDDNILGKVVYIRVNSMWYRGSNYYDLWWRGTWEKEGGGCTLNHSVHQIDILLWLLGKPISVYSVIKNYLHNNSEVEDTSLSIIEFENSIAQLGVSLNDHDEKQEFFIQCEKASISIPWSVKCMKQQDNGFPEEDLAAEKKFNEVYNSLEEITLEGHSAQIKNFLDAIDNKSELIVSAEEGYNALEVITAIYKSSLYKQLIELPLEYNDEFMNKETFIKKMPRFYEKRKSVENLTGKIST